MIKIPLEHLAVQLFDKHSKTSLQSDFAVEQSCTSVEESKSIRDSEIPRKKKNQMNWTDEQYDCFIIFWIRKICDDPSKNYFFSLPLKRNDYFKDLSQFLTCRLGLSKEKTHYQCKSKFSSIKRKIKFEKMKGKISQAYEFIDYLKTEAYIRQERSTDIKDALRRLQMMESCVSEEVLNIRQMTLYQNSFEMNIKNNSIYKYLKTCEQQAEQSD